MDSGDTLVGAVRHSVLTLSGDAPSIKVENGMLVVRDGPHVVPPGFTGPAPPVAERVETLRLPRAGCPVKNIVVTRPDGFLTFAALEWLHQVGVSLTQLDWHGEVIAAIGPPGPDRPAMRRAQALAAGSEVGLAIMREILRHKLAGQAAVARLLGGDDTAALIERLGGEVATAQTGLQILGAEAGAAAGYWSIWSDVCMRFARRDKVPDHWQVFGTRRRPLVAPDAPSGMAGAKSPKNAVSAPGAMLNYLYGLAVSQMTIALVAVGLDPGIGVFHADKDGRASLAYDAIEAVRPYIEAWLLCVLAECRFAKRDFWEEDDGTIRITRPLTSWLALTAPLWRQAAEVVARWLADAFASRAAASAWIEDRVIESAEVGGTLPEQVASRPRLVERLDGRPALCPLPAPLPTLPAPGRAYKPALAHKVMPRACHECGRALQPGDRGSRGPRKFCSTSCASVYRSEMRRLAPSVESHIGTEIAALRAADRERSATARRRAIERHQWDRARKSGGDEAAATLRRRYIAEVQPRLAAVPQTAIMQALQVSRGYARDLARRGRVPHPRHFEALAKLAPLARKGST
jgi:CRISPR-associated endonuclease Cas1